MFCCTVDLGWLMHRRNKCFGIRDALRQFCTKKRLHLLHKTISRRAIKFVGCVHSKQHYRTCVHETLRSNSIATDELDVTPFYRWTGSNSALQMNWMWLRSTDKMDVTPFDIVTLKPEPKQQCLQFVCCPPNTLWLIYLIIAVFSLTSDIICFKSSFHDSHWNKTTFFYQFYSTPQRYCFLHVHSLFLLSQKSSEEFLQTSTLLRPFHLSSWSFRWFHWFLVLFSHNGGLIFSTVLGTIEQIPPIQFSLPGNTEEHLSCMPSNEEVGTRPTADGNVLQRTLQDDYVCRRCCRGNNTPRTPPSHVC